MCDNLIYTLQNDHYILGTNSMEQDSNADVNQLCVNLIIKDQIEGIPVTNVGAFAFRNHKNLKTIYIPNSIILLQFDCFGYNDNLESVIFEERYNTSLSIGRGVFVGCKKLKEIRLPSYLSSSGSWSFSGSGLKSIVYCGMTEIKDDWFSGTNPIVYVHNMYPYQNFSTNPNLIRTAHCGTYNYCFKQSIVYHNYSFDILKNYIYVIINIIY